RVMIRHDRVSLVAYHDAASTTQRLAYVVADGVGARDSSGGRFVDQNGESAYSLEFSSPEHDPRGLRGYPLLRVPAWNASSVYEDAWLPGERITLDGWFAEPIRGYAIVLVNPSSLPGRPEYIITMDLDRLRDPAQREHVHSLALFETISDETLDRVLRAFFDAD
ncbi:MAG: hypothetical protein AAGH64_05455, partial [Planctomycetota bacterium]